jgi:ABC-type branched-subunit amino acid transport system ATPase component
MTRLTLSGITKRFGGVTAVSGVNLQVGSGITGLIGPNGAGKSTLVSLMAGYRRPDAGTLSFEGRDITGMDPAAIARLGISRTFQQAAPLPGLTALENVMVGMHTRFTSNLAGVAARTRRWRAEEAQLGAEAASLLDLVGLREDADAPAESLTFGKLRFLEIARALAMKPRLLLLDEPAAGLNGFETQKLELVIRKVVAQGMDVLLIDHDVPFVFRLCDRVVVLNFGEVLAQGAPGDMFNDPAVREAYLGSAQLEET